MYKGVTASMMRLALGSAAQLSSYSELKQRALASGRFTDGPLLHVCLSFASVVFGVTVSKAFKHGACVCAHGSSSCHEVRLCKVVGDLYSCVTLQAMQPLDVIRTRLYNQPFDVNGRGLLYAGRCLLCVVIWSVTEKLL